MPTPLSVVAALPLLLSIGSAPSQLCEGPPTIAIEGAPTNYFRTEPGMVAETTARQLIYAPGPISCIEFSGLNNTKTTGEIVVQVLDAVTLAVLGTSEPVPVASWPTAPTNPMVWQLATFATPIIPSGDVLIAFLPHTINSYARFQVVADTTYPRSSGQQYTGSIRSDFAVRIYPPTAFPRFFLFRANYETLPATVTGEIYADGLLAVPNVRPLEPLCVPSPAPGVSCASFSLLMSAGSSKSISMKAVDIATGVKSGFSNEVLAIAPTFAPRPTPTITMPLLTPTPTKTPTRTPTVTPTTNVSTILRVEVYMSDGSVVVTRP